MLLVVNTRLRARAYVYELAIGSLWLQEHGAIDPLSWYQTVAFISIDPVLVKNLRHWRVTLDFVIITHNLTSDVVTIVICSGLLAQL